MKFYKYQGAGNDFLIMDNRDGGVSVSDGVLYDGTVAVRIDALCDRRYGVGADGVMLLENSKEYDFAMLYFNSDGSGGMMCGNGGRCMVAFAADCGIGHFDFEAADGFHTAEILSSEGKTKTVRLKMKDVESVKSYGNAGFPSAAGTVGGEPVLNGYFLDTGTRHFVTFTDDISGCDIVGTGRKIRYMAGFGPIGVNVNFVCRNGFSLVVRTYEKGVEDETYACGTGIVASAVASWLAMASDEGLAADGSVRFDVRAVRDNLSVEFVPGAAGYAPVAKDVWLTGPATFVAEVIL